MYWLLALFGEVNILYYNFSYNLYLEHETVPIDLLH